MGFVDTAVSTPEQEPLRHSYTTSPPVKHTTALFSLSNHYILSREWRVIVDQVPTNYNGRPVVL